MISFSSITTLKAETPSFSKKDIFSNDVVEPFTLKPFAIKAFANGNPNQPQPKTAILFIWKLYF